MSGDVDLGDANERATTRRVQDSLDGMHRERQRFNRARATGTLDVEGRLAMQNAVIDVYEELAPFKHRIEDDAWADAVEFKHGEDDESAPLPDAVAARVVTRTREVGFGRVQTDTEHEPVLVDPADLHDMSEDLDEIAREMGFEPGPDKTVEDVDGGVL